MLSLPIMPLEVHIRYQAGIAIIELHGEVNAGAENVLKEAYTTVERQNIQVILLNYSQVNYINSTGIALIITLLAQARKSQRILLACGLSEHYIEIFQITRLIDFMRVFPDEASALAQVQTLPIKL